MSVRGVLQVHSAPPALCSHVEWAVAGVIGVPVSLPWVSQAAAPGMLRAELDWQGSPGASATITSALAGWNRLRFEVTEEASPGCDAVRYSYTPDLGIFSAVTMANGDILVPESRLRAVMTVAAATPVMAGSGGPGPGEQPGGRDLPAARPALGRRARAVPLRRRRRPGPLAARHRLSPGPPAARPGPATRNGMAVGTDAAIRSSPVTRSL